MTPAITLYLALTIALASWLVVHVLAVAAAWRAQPTSGRARALALVPPFTAIAAARAGRRPLALAWGALALTYLVLLALAMRA